jgi:predicted dithiol-disulfide oxidoreductase (DUF899 family)
MKTKEKPIPQPKIVSRGEWIVKRKKLLEREKELTRHGDRVNAERRRLPMVKTAVRSSQSSLSRAPRGRLTSLN